MSTPLAPATLLGTLSLSPAWTAARLAVAAPFLVSGILKLADFDGATAEVRGLTGLEPAALFAAAVILVQLGGSALMLASPRRAWLGAGLLAGFTIVATLLAHAFWDKPPAERPMHLNIFFEHVAIVGGLALVALGSLRGGRHGHG